MKQIMQTLMIAALAFAFDAQAQDEGNVRKQGRETKKQAQQMRQMIRKHLGDAADKDGDGKVTEAEIAAAETEFMAKFDGDKDGTLNAEERKAVRDHFRQEMLKKWDKDGDGKLSEDEKNAIKTTRLAEQFKAADKDGDGKLSPEEFSAMRDQAVEKAKARDKGDRGDKGARAAKGDKGNKDRIHGDKGKRKGEGGDKGHKNAGEGGDKGHKNAGEGGDKGGEHPEAKEE